MRSTASSGLPSPAASSLGKIWTLTLNGASFGYGAQQSDVSAPEPLASVASHLATIVVAGGRFSATTDGAALVLTPLVGGGYTAAFTGTAGGTGTLSAAFSAAWAKLVLGVTVTTPVPATAAWSVTLNAGASPASAIAYTFTAGSHGQTTLLAPFDVKIIDDEAPGVLVLQPNGSTNLVEPSPFVVLGDGFVTALLSTCGVAGTSVTCFQGAFGSADVKETTYHGSLATAQDLDLGSWGKNANPDVENATSVAHITVHGTGDGTDDYYRFTVTPSMLATSGGSIRVSFDIDHGYKPGDAIIWTSRLKLYADVAGDLIAQGAGQSSPSVGAGGSVTFLDDYLAATLTHAGDYFVSRRSLEVLDEHPGRREIRPAGLGAQPRHRRLRVRAVAGAGAGDRQQHWHGPEHRRRAELLRLLQRERRRHLDGLRRYRHDHLADAVRADRRDR